MNYKLFRNIFSVLVILLIAAVFGVFSINHALAESRPNVYGLISDIHACKEKIRTTGGYSAVYPRQALAKFQKALNEMKDKVDFVIVLGDSVNRGNAAYAQKVKDIADASGMPIIWVKGNHDRKTFGIFSQQDYYYKDINGQRIIVLDNVEQHGNTIGSIDDAQLAWFKSVIQDNSIVVAHVPFFDKNLNVIPRYQVIVDLINQTDSNAYFGHWHVAWKKDNFEGIPALTNSSYFIRSADTDLPNNIWVIPKKHSGAKVM